MTRMVRYTHTREGTLHLWNIAHNALAALRCMWLTFAVAWLKRRIDSELNNDMHRPLHTHTKAHFICGTLHTMRCARVSVGILWTQEVAIDLQDN